MTAETISLTLTGDELRAVQESVAAGEYPSASAVLRDAVRLWDERRREQAARLDAIRARIQRSLDDPSPDLSGEDVQAHLDTLFAQVEPETRRA